MKPKFNLTQILQIQTLAIGGIIFIISLFSLIFLYKNFYKTLTETREIIIIRDQIALEQINTELFNQVTEDLKNKKTAPEINWATFKNPFLPYENIEEKN